MRIICFVLSCLLLAGCAIYRQSYIHTVGTNLKTPYGMGNVEITYNATTKVKVFSNAE